jgi:hypothetical protein
VRAPPVGIVAVKVAAPVALFSVALPRLVLPSAKFTVPVGRGAPVTPVTVTVRAVVPFTLTVVGLAVTVVVEPAEVTVKVEAVLVDFTNVASPLYTSVSECVPPVRETMSDAAPLTIAVDPSDVVPS